MASQRYLLMAIIGLLLSGCVSATIPQELSAPELPEGKSRPFIDVSARSAQIQQLSDIERNGYCAGSVAFSLSEYASPSVKMSGRIDRADVNVQHFFNDLNIRIAAHIAGDKNALGSIKTGLYQSAQMNAFEKVARYRGGGFTYNPYNEPIFHQSLLLLSLGIIYPELEHRYGNDDPEVIAIKQWGDRVFAIADSGRDDFKGQYRGLDRAAAKAAAFSVWGTSTNSRDALAAGHRYFRRAISSIGDGGKDTNWGSMGHRQLYYVNMTYGWSVVAAEALVRAGLTNAYDLPAEDRSLHDAVAWLVTALRQDNNLIAANGSSFGSRNLAWAEYYVARFPDKDISNVLDRNLHRSSFYGGIYGGMFGGSTTCLAKRIQN